MACRTAAGAAAAGASRSGRQGIDGTLRAPLRRVVRPSARLGWIGSGAGSPLEPMTRGRQRHTLAAMSTLRPVEAVQALRGDGSLTRRLTMVTLLAATVLAVHAPARN